jgi:hypothetical protein
MGKGRQQDDSIARRPAVDSNFAPKLSVRELSDFENFRLVFGQWGGQFQQISRGHFRGQARIYGGVTVRAFQAETNQAIFTRGLDRSNLATVIPITSANEKTLWRGRRLKVGQLLVKGPDVEYYNQTMRNTLITALLVPVEIIESLPSTDCLQRGGVHIRNL